MSKSDASGAQSLEEILAQIKKSVAGEPGTARAGAAQGAGEETGARAADGGLSQRLAGVLQEAGTSTPTDGDGAELLATEAADKGAPTDPGKPVDARSQRADPLWFLRQPSGAAPDNSASAQTEPTLPGPARVEEEIKLSRPQDLRSSLPPLFGTDNEQLPVARLPVADVPIAPLIPPPQVAAPEATAKLVPDNILTAKTQPVLPAAEAGATADQAELDAQPMSGAATIIARPVSATPPSTEVDLGAQPQGVATAPPDADQEHHAAASAPAAADTQARTLEQVIGELLEPVIRQWLEANLPRLVEEVVRKEVVRAIAERSTSVV
jgi:uncharacterized protein